jgi:hypothetical protein
MKAVSFFKFATCDFDRRSPPFLVCGCAAKYAFFRCAVRFRRAYAAVWRSLGRAANLGQPTVTFLCTQVHNPGGIIQK